MLRAWLLAPLLLATPAVAGGSYVLGFSGDICGGSCALGDAIDPDYGSVPGLKLSWRSLDGVGDANEVTPHVLAGRISGDEADIPPYGPDPAQTVAFAPFEAAVGEARFELTMPGSITLQSIETIVFDRFQGHSSVFRIYDLNYTLLFESEAVGLPETEFALVSFGAIKSTTGLILQWGAVTVDGFPTGADTQGIDTLVFDFAMTSKPPVVPEPATWAMLILGFGVVGTAARRRRREIAAG
jgi:hypothetical protein